VPSAAGWITAATSGSTQLWAEDDLVARLGTALKIAARTVQVLAKDGFFEPGDDDANVESAKIIAETAILLFAASPAGRISGEIQARIDLVAELLKPHARSNAVRIAICLKPALALDYALAHVCLSYLGRKDKSLDELLEQSLAAYEANGRERLPYRDLEQRWIASIRTATDDTLLSLVASDHSVLKRPLDGLCAERTDVYAFTHSLMYLTNFGRRDARLPRPADALLWDATYCLMQALDREDYDLGGEILLTWPLLCGAWSGAASFAFRVLTRVEDAAGFLPSPITRVDQYRRIALPERKTQYALASAYHTAYVMGLLCSAILTTGRRPATSSGGQDTTSLSQAKGEAATDRVKELILEESQPKPHWMLDFERSTAAEQAELAPMMLIVALQRAARAKNLAKISAILRTSIELEIETGPVGQQAAQLLRRSADCAARMGLLPPVQN
jgi:hypothetical protein